MNYPFRSYFLAIISYLGLLIFAASKQFYSPSKSATASSSMFIEAISTNHLNLSKSTSGSSLSKAQALQNNLESLHSKSEINQKSTDRNNSENIDDVGSGTQKSKIPIFRPLPEIPEEMRYEAFNSLIVARFVVGKNGEVLKVELVKSADDPRLNSLLIKSLKKWRFEPSTQDLIVEIKVNFRVE